VLGIGKAEGGMLPQGLYSSHLVRTNAPANNFDGVRINATRLVLLDVVLGRKRCSGTDHRAAVAVNDEWRIAAHQIGRITGLGVQIGAPEEHPAKRALNRVLAVHDPGLAFDSFESCEFVLDK